MTTFGSARIDENGKAIGGSAGDQTGKEVSTQTYYMSKLGWVVLRAKDKATRKKIAKAMSMACANDKIGYDQGQRNTLYNEASKVDFDISKVTTACETDCSALVRVCLAYAGVMVGDFNTASEKAVIFNTGKFEIPFELTSEDELMTGDILVTKTKGHTVIVVSADTKESTKTSSSNGCYAQCDNHFTSIVEALASIGEKDTSLTHRKKIATANGIGTSATFTMNVQLLAKLKRGELKKA